jgi:endonuclease/exonuclease/phosphatase family metal-dependent hydrolase
MIHNISDRLGAWSFEYTTSSLEQWVKDSQKVDTWIWLVWDSIVVASAIVIACIALISFNISIWTTPEKGCVRLTTKPSLSSPAIKVVTWNINGLPGCGFPNRVKQVANRILKLNALIVFVQEAYGNAAYRLREELAPHFSTTIDRIGVRTLGLDSGLGCYTNLEVLDCEYIPYKDHPDDRAFVSHGFLTVKTPNITYIGTHLTPGTEKSNLRQAQFEQMQSYMNQKPQDHFCVVGDLNIGDSPEDYQTLNLSSYDVASPAEQTIPTYRDAVQALRDDYILFNPLSSLKDRILTILDPGTDSDHSPLILKGTT